ncbi:unnamed protein product [Penicillium salamii]|uniref:thioredoxin-dependent peroxiredoxin n=1 Tax=Penicillium salamii TaxID=1612424 RepID=A0A9W4J9I2_9EURO|nr:unnamed protein product [Penicillium salamii]CAG8319096.1 unnamed protein product [Penicillium salamii]CAG8380203.1 unnamed protein product [Penicillium salamii]
MVELRKRKAPATAAPPVEKKPKAAKPRAELDEKEEVKSSKVPEVGDVIDIEVFGGEVQTNEGETTSLKKLLEESKTGVVFFTYPKASTPGCTKQACLFRDHHTHLTSSGLAIYGLSGDSPKANTTFKTRQNLPYPLLCDPQANLIAAIGLKKSPKGTVRGVFAVDKKGKVLLRESGGPDATVDAVQKIVANAPKVDQEQEAEPDTKQGDKPDDKQDDLQADESK